MLLTKNLFDGDPSARILFDGVLSTKNLFDGGPLTRMLSDRCLFCSMGAFNKDSV